MASSKDVKLHTGSTAESSLECTTVSGSSIQFDNAAFIESCPPILEPSKCKSRSKETSRYSLEIFASHPPPTPTFVPALVGTDSIRSFDVGEDQQRNGEHESNKCCTSCCSAIFNCYSISAIAFRNSRFFYIVQLLICLLPLSTMVMGLKYSKYCSTTFPVLTFIIGIFGSMLVGVWISINAFHHFGRRCTGQQKFLLILLFGLLTILLTIEITLYFSASPSFDSADKNYCDKIFIDFTFYKYIAIGVALILLTILYIPDCRSFICNLECSIPIGDVPYDQI